MFALSVFTNNNLCLWRAKSLTGKEQLVGYDAERRPALYMMPSRQNTEESPRQLQFAVWMLERAVDVMGPGVE